MACWRVKDLPPVLHDVVFGKSYMALRRVARAFTEFGSWGREGW